MRKCIEEFHYCADGVNPVRYRVGAMVPVKPGHVDKLVAEGKIEREGNDNGAMLETDGSHLAEWFAVNAEPMDIDVDQPKAAVPLPDGRRIPVEMQSKPTRKRRK